MICEMLTPFQGQEINDVPLPILEKWLASVAPKYALRPPKEHRLLTFEAVKASVENRRSGSGKS